MSSSAYPGPDRASGGGKPSSNDPSQQPIEDAFEKMRQAADDLYKLQRAEHDKKEAEKAKHLNDLRESIHRAKQQRAKKSELHFLINLYRTSAVELRPVTFEEAQLKERSMRKFAADHMTFPLEKKGLSKNEAMKVILKNLISESHAKASEEQAGAGVGAGTGSTTPEALIALESRKANAMLDVLSEILSGGDLEISEVVRRIAVAEIQPSREGRDPSAIDERSQGPAEVRRSSVSSTENSRESDGGFEIVFEESPPAVRRRSSTSSNKQSAPSSDSEFSDSEYGAGIEPDHIDSRTRAEQLKSNPGQILEASPATTTTRERSKSWSYGYKAVAKPENSPLGLSKSSPNFQRSAVRDITNL